MWLTDLMWPNIPHFAYNHKLSAQAVIGVLQCRMKRQVRAKNWTTVSRLSAAS